MNVLYKIRKCIALLITGSLIILLIGCEQKVSLDNTDKEIDMTEESVTVKVKRESERLSKDKPDEEEEEGITNNRKLIN